MVSDRYIALVTRYAEGVLARLSDKRTPLLYDGLDLASGEPLCLEGHELRDLAKPPADAALLRCRRLVEQGRKWDQQSRCGSISLARRALVRPWIVYSRTRKGRAETCRAAHHRCGSHT